jgi:sugar lactone lactonase YvrE
LLAAWTVSRAWGSARRLPRGRVSVAAFATAAIAAGALLIIVFAPNSTAFHVGRMGVAALAAFAIAFVAAPLGRRGAGLIAIAAVAGALSIFSLRTMVDVSFTRGDVPKDMLIYTQSSPEIPAVMEDIEELAAATGKGKFLPIAVDSRDSFAWPWAWYLRDYKCVAYPELTNGNPGTSQCEGVEQPYAVLLVNNANVGAVEDWIDENYPGYYGTPRDYAHRWWFPETYKDAVRVGDNFSCTAQAGDCGPYQLETWKEIFSGIDGGWLRTWYRYWRDHDPDEISGRTGDRECNSCGSVDASAYFPAAFDTASGLYTSRPLPPPQPSLDSAGRPFFGGRGSQDGNFARPVDIEADVAGNLYVIDRGRRRLQKFDAAGNVIASLDVREGSDVPDSEPWGLALLPDGSVLVADTFAWRMRLFDSNLQLIRVFGETPTLDDDTPPLPAELFGPRDAATDAEGNVWVTDTGQDRLVVFSPDGTPLRTIGEEGDGPGQFNEPVGIAIADDGTIFVTDVFNGRVVVLDSEGRFQSSFPVEGWGVEAEDKAYVEALRDGRIAVSLPARGEVRVYSADGTLLGTIAPTDEPLDLPYGMVEAADGKLWVVEGGAARVRLFPLP